MGLLPDKLPDLDLGLPTLPPWAEKMKLGFIMGGSAGMCVGFLYGSMTVLRGGPSPGKGYMSTIGSFMLQHGAMLGFFLSIGSLLRAEEQHNTIQYPISQSPFSLTSRRAHLPVVIERRRPSQILQSSL
ncbi:subunit of TIM23 translocase complex [Rhizophlyctis rosea]|uniref:Subunit of TIM23 translocase complex n=1 Tax=Rhizophlyctis rosea TaxID=64517 RepID=A0AAD5S5Z0_9FUNG|nr:subunit of TIM23 translocase complex [Rhizophlyctis rosea]